MIFGAAWSLCLADREHEANDLCVSWGGRKHFLFECVFLRVYMLLKSRLNNEGRPRGSIRPSSGRIKQKSS